MRTVSDESLVGATLMTDKEKMERYRMALEAIVALAATGDLTAYIASKISTTALKTGDG